MRYPYLHIIRFQQHLYLILRLIILTLAAASGAPHTSAPTFPCQFGLWFMANLHRLQLPFALLVRQVHVFHVGVVIQKLLKDFFDGFYFRIETHQARLDAADAFQRVAVNLHAGRMPRRSW